MIILFLFCTLYLLRLLLGMASVFGIHTLTYQSLGWGVVLREYRFDFDNNLMEMNQPVSNPFCRSGRATTMIRGFLTATNGIWNSLMIKTGNTPRVLPAVMPIPTFTIRSMT